MIRAHRLASSLPSPQWPSFFYPRRVLSLLLVDFFFPFFFLTASLSSLLFLCFPFFIDDGLYADWPNARYPERAHRSLRWLSRPCWSLCPHFSDKRKRPSGWLVENYTTNQPKQFRVGAAESESAQNENDAKFTSSSCLSLRQPVSSSVEPSNGNILLN